MQTTHRNYLIEELIRGIAAIGPLFETFGQRVADYLIEDRLIHRGLNAKGMPVGNTVDSNTVEGNIVVEYSADQTYFKKPFKKLKGDIKHALNNHPQVKHIYLLAGQVCGPTLDTRLANLRHRTAKRFGVIIDVHDARRIAEMIFDELLLNDEAIETLSPFLAPLERIRNEYAATQLLPTSNSSYIPQQDTIDELIDHIKTKRFVGLAGVSGSGKSEAAVEVANQLKVDFELTVWISASELREIKELEGIDVERCGRNVSVASLLRSRSCLLILDDLKLMWSIDEFSTYLGADSAIIVTRQIAHADDLRISMLSKADAKTLLFCGIDEECPDEVLQKALDVAGGHPLSLRLMNAGVRKSSWSDLASDCELVGEYTASDFQGRLSDRLFVRIQPNLERELAFFTWCDSHRIDKAFAREALKSLGLRKLDDSCILATDRSDVIRLHDVVWSILKNTKVPMATYQDHFDACFDKHITKLAFAPSEALNFLNFCQLHRRKIESILRSKPTSSSCVYCLTHVWSDEDIDCDLLPNPESLCDAIENGVATEDIDVSALCEVIESLYRRDKRDQNLERARDNLRKRFNLFDRVANANGVSQNGRRIALHHKAKGLRNVREFDKAIELAEEVLAISDSAETRLLLARLLSYGEKSENLRAQSLLMQILQDASEHPDESEISVALAAIETLGWGLNRKFTRDALPKALVKHGRQIADLITSAGARGFDQAFSTFAAIGRAMRYHNEGLFISVLESLGNIDPSDNLSDKERAAWGDIFLTMSESLSIEQPVRHAKTALEFYLNMEMPSDFIYQQIGKAYFRTQQFGEASKILEPLVERNPNPWNRFWLSKVLLSYGRHEECLKLIDKAIEAPEAKSFLPTFYEHRFDVRNDSGDTPNAIDDLRTAHELCQESSHKSALAKKLVEHDRG